MVILAIRTLWWIQRGFKGFAWTFIPVPRFFLDILWKWNETKLFHFHGVFKKNKTKSAKRNPPPIPIYKRIPFPEILDPPLQPFAINYMTRASIVQNVNYPKNCKRNLHFKQYMHRSTLSIFDLDIWPPSLYQHSHICILLASAVPVMNILHQKCISNHCANNYEHHPFKNWKRNSRYEFLDRLLVYLTLPFDSKIKLWSEKFL